MKTNIKILATFALFSLFAKAQVNVKFNYGVLGGVGVGAAEIGDFGRRGTQTISGKNISNMNMGVFVQSQKGDFYIKTAASYVVQQGMIKSIRNNSFTMDKIEVPFLFGANIFGPVVIEAGPVYDHIFNITQNYDSDYSNTSFGKNGLGFRAATGLDFDSFFILGNFQRITFADPNYRNALKEPYQVSLIAGLKLGYFASKARTDEKKYAITPGR